MANITAASVLSTLDSLLPNQYSPSEKLRWLTQAEAYIQREILGNTDELPQLSTSSRLTAETPYDEMYRYYVEAQIHYANGEMARYNNAAAAWNSGFVAYRDYLARAALPGSRAEALRLC